MNKFILSIALTISILITGCVNSDQLFKRQDFTSYLDQFIGKSKQDVMSSIHLQRFGFETVTQSRSLQSTDTLVYSIIRPISIPIPIAEANYAGGSSASGMRPTLHTATNSYEVNMTCNIIFKLENNIVTKWDAKGKAC